MLRRLRSSVFGHLGIALAERCSGGVFAATAPTWAAAVAGWAAVCPDGVCGYGGQWQWWQCCGGRVTARWLCIHRATDAVAPVLVTGVEGLVLPQGKFLWCHGAAAAATASAA